MKKNFYWLFIMACVSLISFTSCDPKDPVDDPDETTKMRIKTMTFEYDWGSGPGSTSYAYTYDAQGRVIKVVETGEDWTDEFNLD